MLIFHGQLIHAGAEWVRNDAEENIRLHVYMLPADIEFPEPTITYPVPSWVDEVCIPPSSEFPDVPPDPVQPSPVPQAGGSMFGGPKRRRVR